MKIFEIKDIVIQLSEKGLKALVWTPKSTNFLDYTEKYIKVDKMIVALDEKSRSHKLFYKEKFGPITSILFEQDKEYILEYGKEIEVESTENWIKKELFKIFVKL